LSPFFLWGLRSDETKKIFNENYTGEVERTDRAQGGGSRKACRRGQVGNSEVGVKFRSDKHQQKFARDAEIKKGGRT